MITSFLKFCKERTSGTPVAAPSGDQGQPKPKPRTDSGTVTGTAGGIANPSSRGNPPPTRSAKTNPNPNASKLREQPQLNGYSNTGTQNIKGLTNLTGYIRGNANGAINFGNLTASAVKDGYSNPPPPTQPGNIQEQVAALHMLVDTVNKLDDGKNDSTTQQSSYSYPPGPGKVTKGNDFNNTGTQNITGLCNLTGYTEGDANGAINFGELRC